MSLLNNKRREEVETTIRSCLVARQGDVTIQQLDSDFTEFEGEHIPYKEFGYHSLHSFLKQLHNVLWLDERSSGFCYVKAIDSEKSRHVSSLVEGQRRSRSQRFPTRRSQRPYCGFPGGRPQVSINSRCLMHLIREVNTYPDGINLDSAIQYVNKVSRPVEITRNELERQLRAVQHKVAIGDNKLYPANRTGGSSRFNNTYIPPPRLRASHQSSSNGSYSRPLQRVEAMAELTSSVKKDLPIRFTGEDDEAIDADDIVPKYPSGYTPASEPPRRNGYRDQEPSGQNYESRNSYKERENNLHKEREHRNEDYREQNSHGNQNSYRETSNHPRDSTVTKNSSKDHQNSRVDQYDDTKYSEDKNHYEESRVPEDNYNGEDYGEDDDFVVNDDEFLEEDYAEDRSALINDKIRARLEILIRNNPDGIWCADLPQKYLEKFCIPLNYLELGFNSVCEFAAQLPTIFHCVRPSILGDYKLYNAKAPAPDLRNGEPQTRETLASKYSIYDDGQDDPEVFPGRLDPSTTMKLFPEGAMELGETVGHISVTELGKELDYEEVEVSEVFTPSFFWIQLRRKKPKFKKFMYELHAFYEANKSKFRIPLIMLEKGLNVACIYDHKWHRGIIKTVLPDGRSTVHFYDYGTVKSYVPEGLYFLHRQFSYLPAQAIPCGLFNVRPYETDKWTKQITWEFVTKTSVPLVATIGARNEEENSLLVSLTDTRADEDFHINDWMYLKKYAQQGRMDIDLQNLCNYEEDKLPQWDQVAKEEFEEQRQARKNERLKKLRDEELKVQKDEESAIRENEESADLFSSNLKKSQQRPPPGFSALSAVVEEDRDQPIINSENLITPNFSANPSIPVTFMPALSSFMNVNLPQNTYSNLVMNSPNMFGQNSLNTGVNATKIQMEIFNMQLQINNLAMMIGQLGITSPDTGRILQAQMNFLMKQCHEMQLRNAQYANSTLPIPNLHNLGTSPQKTPPPSSFIKLNPTPSEFADFVTNLPSSQSSPVPSNSNYSQSSNSTEKSYESAKSRVGTSPDSLPSNNYQSTNPSASNEKIEFSDNMDIFFKGVPKLSDKTETLKNTNPFKTSVTENKLDRASLKNFLDAPPPVPSRDPNLINKSKTENFNTSNISKPRSDLFVFGSGEEEDMSANLQKPPTINFDPVVCPSTENVNQDSKIVYEAGPVIYKKNEAVTKSDNNYSDDKSRWKPIPPADNEPSRSRDSVQISVTSFNITKPKSPAERLKERQLESSLEFKTAEKDLSSNVTDQNARSTITLTDFKAPSNWVNIHILSPGKLTNNEKQYDEVSNCSQEDNVPTPARRPQAEIFMSVTDTSPNPKAEIFTSVTEGRHLIEKKPETTMKNILEAACENGPTIDKTEHSSTNATSYFRSTNPFAADLGLKISNEEVEYRPNGVTKDLEAFEFAEEVGEPSNQVRKIPEVLGEDASICFMYDLKSKDMSIVVIDMNNEGWLSTDEFVAAFTTLEGGGSVLVSVLEMLKYKISFETVDRSTHPMLLSKLDRTSLAVQRDSQNKICRPVHLTPLKCSLRILTKLKIFKREEVNIALVNKQYTDGTILNDVVKLMLTYGIFLRTKCKI